MSVDRSVFDRMTMGLVDQGCVPAEEQDLYAYGLRQGAFMLLNLATTITIGFMLGMVWQSVAFMAAYVPIRSYAGGYHAKTRTRCYLLSIALIAVVLLIIKLAPWTRWACLLVTLAAGVVIYFRAPVESRNKPLSQTEVRVYRRKARMILLGEAVILCLCMILGAEEVSYCIAMALATAGAMVGIRRMK